jgi:hypothetical protein
MRIPPLSLTYHPKLLDTPGCNASNFSLNNPHTHSLLFPFNTPGSYTRTSPARMYKPCVSRPAYAVCTTSAAPSAARRAKSASKMLKKNPRAPDSSRGRQVCKAGVQRVDHDRVGVGNVGWVDEGAEVADGVELNEFGEIVSAPLESGVFLRGSLHHWRPIDSFY